MLTEPKQKGVLFSKVLGWLRSFKGNYWAILLSSGGPYWSISSASQRIKRQKELWYGRKMKRNPLYGKREQRVQEEGLLLG